MSSEDAKILKGRVTTPKNLCFLCSSVFQRFLFFSVTPCLRGESWFWLWLRHAVSPWCAFGFGLLPSHPHVAASQARRAAGTTALGGCRRTGDHFIAGFQRPLHELGGLGAGV